MALRKQIIAGGSIIGALAVMIGSGYKATSSLVNALDARYLPVAYAADIKSIQSDLLQLRHESLNRERLEIERAARTRALSDIEHDRLDYLKREMRKLDQRIRKLDESGG